jgi:hypothetical protein
MLEFLKGERPDFVARAAVQREFDHTACNLPRNSFALKSVSHDFR